MSLGKTCTERYSGPFPQLGIIKMAKTDLERGEAVEEGLEGTQHHACGVKWEGEMSHTCGAVWGAYGTPTPGSGFSMEDVGNKQWYFEDYIWSPIPSSLCPVCYGVSNLLLHPQSPAIMMTAGPESRKLGTHSVILYSSKPLTMHSEASFLPRLIRKRQGSCCAD